MNENTGAAPQLNNAKEASFPYHSLSACGEGRGEVPQPNAQPETRDSGHETRDGLSARREGGQPGNQNARKHGFYSRYLTPRQRQNYDEACEVKGTCSELGLLRCKLAGMLEQEPVNIALVNRLIITINRLESDRPVEAPEPSERSRQIMSGFFAQALASGDERTVRAFDDWMAEHFGDGPAIGNGSIE